MAQVSWRAPDGVVARVRLQADHLGLSMNEYLTRVMQAATDPSFAPDPAHQVRERLRLAGLLAPGGDASDAPEAPDPALVAEARARAGTGTALADIVTADR